MALSDGAHCGATLVLELPLAPAVTPTVATVATVATTGTTGTAGTDGTITKTEGQTYA
jgi:hypothetical protein